jgi:hypothetical protein
VSIFPRRKNENEISSEQRQSILRQLESFVEIVGLKEVCSMLATVCHMRFLRMTKKGEDMYKLKIWMSNYDTLKDIKIFDTLEGKKK